MCLQNKTSQQEFKNIKKMIYKYAIFLLKTMLIVIQKVFTKKNILTEIHVFF